MKRSRRLPASSPSSPAGVRILLSSAKASRCHVALGSPLFIWAHYLHSSVTAFVTLRSPIRSAAAFGCRLGSRQKAGEPEISASRRLNVTAPRMLCLGEVSDLRVFGALQPPDNPGCVSASARSYLQTAERSRAAAYLPSHFGGCRCTYINDVSSACAHTAAG